MDRLRKDYGVVPTQKAKTHYSGLLQKFQFNDGPLSPQLSKFDDLVRSTEAAGAHLEGDDIVSLLLAKMPPAWEGFAEKMQESMEHSKVTLVQVKLKIREKEKYAASRDDKVPMALAASTGTPAPREPLKCFSCGQPGHRKADCTTNPKTCFVCGGKGHEKPQCPSPGGGAHVPVRGRAAAAMSDVYGHNDGNGFMF
jgi:hypothetical protein